MSKFLKFGLASLIIFVALVYMVREVPEISRLANDPSNDGAFFEVVRPPKANPLQATGSGRNRRTQIFRNPRTAGYSSSLAFPASIRAPWKHGMDLLLALCLLRL